ncbi:MAG: efflux RND transporter periplasmic adaptor subunit [Rickettsiales bacterium]|jgi:HlyD family secretion protein|nr:efflux RND transporter periplasmic adaptor subunit [Rickettsiales bacterium]
MMKINLGDPDGKTRFLWWILGALALFAAYRSFAPKSSSASLDKDGFSYAKIRRKTIKSQVSASGNIKPASVVSVGAQVSGIIRKIHVDYNDRVEKGQLLAEIDKSVLAEEINSTEARTVQAKAKYDLAKINKSRVEELYGAGYVARIELDQAETELASAESDYVAANSNFERAKINMRYSEIKSPVSGVVISKDVEEGQTIAASFSAPTLFKIAEDLSKMQIDASISEADIGSIKKGQSVDFTVDAFPLESFEGKVDQVRLNPTTEQNVVIYNVVIRIDNRGGKLLPGMTAFVEINTLRKENVLALENSVLQFRPDDSIVSKVAYPETGGLKPGEGYLYRFDAGAKAIEAVKIRKGITDGAYTEIISDSLKEGDEIISDYTAGGGTAKPKGQPQGRRSGMGGGRRGPV